VSVATRPWKASRLGDAFLAPSRRPVPVLRAGAGAVLVIPPLLAAGWLAADLPVRTALAVAGGVTVLLVLVPAIVARPELGTLLTLVVAAVVPVDTLFEYDLRFLAGGLKVTDLLLVLTLGSWLVGVVVEKRPVRTPRPAVSGLLLALVGLGLLGLVTAWTQDVDLKLSVVELRALLALLLVFPVVDGVRRMVDLERALAVFLVAVAVSAVIITRDFVLGEGNLALFSNEAVRVNNLIFVYPLAGVVWAAAIYPSTRQRVLRFLLLAVIGISGAALYFTARRGGWLAALAGVLVVVALLPGRRRAVLLRSLVLMTAAVMGLVVAANALAARPIESPGASFVERLLSIDEGEEDPSTGHRLAEVRRAQELIASHPLTGIGPGAEFTFISPLYNEELESADVPHTDIYVHSSYVWVALKLGPPALAVFVALLATLLRDAHRSYRRSTDMRARRLLLGALATLAALMAVSFTEPHLTYVGSTPLFVAVIAVISLAPRLEAEQPSQTAV
jgi:O-antigen ligase